VILASIKSYNVSKMRITYIFKVVLVLCAFLFFFIKNNNNFCAENKNIKKFGVMLSRHECNKIIIGTEIGRGITKQVRQGNFNGENVIIKSVLYHNIDRDKSHQPFLPFLKIMKEAMLYSELMQQGNHINEITECNNLYKYILMLERMVHFHNGPIEMRDVKPSQFVKTETGIHMSDIDDSSLKSTEDIEIIRRSNYELSKQKIIRVVGCESSLFESINKLYL